jgi:hypothetical protein
VLALALAILVVLGMSGMGPWDLRSPEPRQDLSAALSAYAKEPAVHLTGEFTRDSHRHQLDVTLDRGGDGQGSLTVDGHRVQYRSVDGHEYAMADQGFWAAQGALSPYLAGRWVTGPQSLDGLSSAALSRALSLLDGARPGVTFDRITQRTRIGSVPVVDLSDPSGDLYVSTGLSNRFVRVVSRPGYRSSDGVTDIRIDLDYPAPVTVVAPSPAVNTDDPTDLPAEYVLDDTVLVHGSDCDVALRCTVTVRVVNERGPQVQPASAEIHLVRDDGSDLGTCTAPIPAVGAGQGASVSCTVSSAAWVAFTRVGGRYSAQITVHNPFYDG